MESAGLARFGVQGCPKRRAETRAGRFSGYMRAKLEVLVPETRKRVRRVHRAAVTRMLRATGLAQVPEEAPLIELLRVLADEMDAGGGARTRAEYLSALKDVRRVLDLGPGRSRPRPVPAEGAVAEAEGVAPSMNELASWRERRGIA